MFSCDIVRPVSAASSSAGTTPSGASAAPITAYSGMALFVARANAVQGPWYYLWY